MSLETTKSRPPIPICLTEGLPNPTYYVEALDGEFSEWAYNEKRAIGHKGQWRKAFGVEESTPLDLEIGTGNGYYFAHHAQTHPERCLLGIEKKFKPLIQSIRRALNEGCKNARILRYHAGFIEDLFEARELDNVYIHFPDPWPKKRQQKNRLIQPKFLEAIHLLQKPGGLLEFKTDNRAYFDQALSRFQASPYTEECITYDLHQGKDQPEVFTTHFEKIFVRQGLPIHYALFRV